MEPVQTVRKLVPLLSQEELADVKQRIDALLQNTTGKLPYDDWLSNGIMTELQRRGLCRLKTLNAKIVPIPKNYRADCAMARDIIIAGTPEKLSDRDKLLLGAIVARSLADNLDNKYGGPLGLKKMLQNVSEAPGAIEESFPGYLAGGMIGMVLRKVGGDS
jgi:hypothetical protein